ncbi:hypothetical protein OROHE_001379 [Orobanche hederae]
MAIKILFLVAIVVAFATAINGRTLPIDKNVPDHLQTEFYHFHFPRRGGAFGGFGRDAGAGFGGVGRNPGGGGFVGGSGFNGGVGTGANGSLQSGGGGSGFDDGAGTGADGNLKSGGGTVDDGVEGGLVP